MYTLKHGQNCTLISHYKVIPSHQVKTMPEILVKFCPAHMPSSHKSDQDNTEK